MQLIVYISVNGSCNALFKDNVQIYEIYYIIDSLSIANPPPPSFFSDLGVLLLYKLNGKVDISSVSV